MTHKQKVLALLSDGNPHTHMELYRLGCVAHSRVSDLRRDGHLIEQWREAGNYLYRLVGTLNDSTGCSGHFPTVPVGSLSVPQPCGAARSTDGSGSAGDERGTLVLFVKEAA